MSQPVVIGDATLYCADCRDVLPMLGRVDAVVTDPPYGVNLGETAGSGGAHGLAILPYSGYLDTYENYLSDVVPALTSAIRIAKRAALFIGPHIHELPKFDAIGGIFCAAAAGRHKWGFKNFLPVLLYGSAPDLHLGAKVATAIASSEIAEKNGHPVPKPLGWMLWLVALASKQQESVLDPFMGSGTTGVACAQLGRKFIGIEREPKYFDIACERIERAYAQGRLFEPEQAKPEQGALL